MDTWLHKYKGIVLLRYCYKYNNYWFWKYVFITDDIDTLKKRILEFEEKEKILLKEKEQQEQEFGLKRAKFKELFLQKEGIKNVKDIIKKNDNSCSYI